MSAPDIAAAADGPKVQPSPDADAQTRLFCFCGRPGT